MGLIKVGTKVSSKAKTGKLAKNNQYTRYTQVPDRSDRKVHAQGVVQTGKRTVGFSVQSQPGKRAEISFGYMNKGLFIGEQQAPYTNKMAALPLPTSKELAVAGGLVGSAYGLGYLQEQADKRKKSGKRSK